MAESAAHLVDEVIPRVPVRQWVLSFPIPLRILFAAHPELLTPVLRIIHRVIAGFVLKQAGLKRTTADTGAVTLIQRFGSAANLNIHVHGLVLDGVYQNTEGEPVFREARAPTREELQGLLARSIARLMKMLTRLRYLIEEEGMTYIADMDADNPLASLQAASWPCGCAGPVIRLLARHDQSTALLESGLGLSHRAGAARRTEGAERANGGRSGRNKHDGPVRRCARRNPGEAQRIPGIVATTPCPKTIPDFAALLPGYTPVPLHYRPRDRQRTAQARWIGGCRAATKKRVA